MYVPQKYMHGHRNKIAWLSKQSESFQQELDFLREAHYKTNKHERARTHTFHHHSIHNRFTHIATYSGEHAQIHVPTCHTLHFALCCEGHPILLAQVSTPM